MLGDPGRGGTARRLIVADVDDTSATRPFGGRTPSGPQRVVPPAPEYDPTVTLSPDDLQATIAGAVIQALALKGEQDAAGKAAQRVDLELAFESRIKRLKLIAGAATAIATIGAIVFGVFKWYADGEVAAAVEARRRTDVDASIQAAEAKHDVDQASNDVAHRDQSEALKDVGVLQLEQGADTRRILLEVATPADKKRLEEKPPELVEAERKVRRSKR